MPPTDAEIELAVAVTGGFENQGDPYIGVAGDFDGMGISCGVLQWNLGCNSLQPLVRDVGEAAVRRAMPRYGAEFWRLCHDGSAAACVAARAWQTSARLEDAVAAELRELMGSSEMRATQRQRIASVAAKADALALDWARAQRRDARSLHEFVWFFDLVTQNGSLRGLGAADVAAFMTAAAPDPVAAICDWLAAAPREWWGREDCLRNAASWRAAVSPAALPLFVLGYLRSVAASEPRARGISMNRKGTIAAKRGFVNGTLYDFENAFREAGAT